MWNSYHKLYIYRVFLQCGFSYEISKYFEEQRMLHKFCIQMGFYLYDFYHVFASVWLNQMIVDIFDNYVSSFSMENVC